MHATMLRAANQFGERAKKVHGDKYDYSRVQYKGARSKVEIVCPDHGPFWQEPRNHLDGHGCSECGAIRGGKAKHTNASFIERARAVHGDKYDYSRVEYKTSQTPVEIVCPDHGPFFPRPGNHVSRKSGCPQCAGYAPTTLELFLQRATKVHGTKYDYSRVQYSGVQTKVEIVCPEHGPFWQEPLSHTNGRGCQKCGVVQCSTAQRLSQETFIARARAIHGDKYDYSQVNYRGALVKIEIVCPEHGPFSQVANYHLTGNGCQKCAQNFPVTREEFITRAQAEHPNKYDYSACDYSGMRTKCTVVCPIHGPFMATPKDHIGKMSGCPSCAREATSSDGERELAAWIESLGLQVVRNDRRELDGLEIDIVVPECRVGIEFNGAFWHSDKALPHPRIHEHKANRADDAGIRLVTVWDFEWNTGRPMIEAYLLRALGKATATPYHARKAVVGTVSPDDACAFYEAHHLQGAPQRSNLHLGLRHDGELIACMSFSRAGNRRKLAEEGEWELTRYATSGTVRGGASRLFTTFVREYAPKTVWSFSDRQHFTGGVYPVLGFIEDGRIKADYRVMHQPPTGRIWHKSAWQRQNIPARLAELGIAEHFDPATDPRTERDMQNLAGVIRIMDAGKIRWKWSSR